MTARATLTQVARRAGVSIASASRAINGLVASPETVRAVQQAAADLGYVPDANARALKMGATFQLLFAVADIGNPVYVEMMRAVEQATRPLGYRLLVSSTGLEPAGILDVIRSLDRGFADGLVISPIQVNDDVLAALRASRYPIAIIGSIPEDLELDSVRANSADGIAQAVEHLRASGRRHIGFINGPRETTPGMARHTAYMAAMDAHGVPAADRLLVDADDFTVAAARDALGTELAGARPGTRPFDAIVAANDLLAIGATHALLDAGLRVGQDVALVGMDDTYLAEAFNPPLTSVNLGSAERATRAAELLMHRIAHPGAPVSRLTIHPSLTIRASSAPRPQGGTRD
ncbi:LacI family DNA-binding transcriptional regulator [Tessaracoccus antarcticus]|uniref:LacI family transcriptional regulator n=1 Tax=Tessaracoccus antarcticus TaxID=2479848 RepID=A0A3M0G8K7_9ACTN|nr:LacI family DNA-binding transcriptional regulator [Tessaracoccus antarcticus]RMB61360.1 LacI family transcriptional regulator [Tessaracoccus antarcticus]